MADADQARHVSLDAGLRGEGALPVRCVDTVSRIEVREGLIVLKNSGLIAGQYVDSLPARDCDPVLAGAGSRQSESPQHLRSCRSRPMAAHSLMALPFRAGSQSGVCCSGRRPLQSWPLRERKLRAVTCPRGHVPTDRSLACTRSAKIRKTSEEIEKPTIQKRLQRQVAPA